MEINENYIKYIARNPNVYNLGTELVKNVFDFEFIKELNVIRAVVECSYSYNVYIEFSKKEENKIESYSCECESFHECKGACTHVVAVLKTAKIYFSSKLFKERSTKNEQNLLPFSEIDLSSPQNKTRVHLWLDQKFIQRGDYMYLNLSLRIGQDRPYMIKYIYEFLNVLMNESFPIDFGKSFTFDPKVMGFFGTDKKILTFLCDLFKKNDRLTDIINTNIHFKTGSVLKHAIYSGIFDINSVILYEDNLKKYLEIIKDSEFPANFFGYMVDKLKIIEDIDIFLKLEENNGKLIMEANYDENMKIIPLVSDYEYVVSEPDFTIYKIPPKKAELLKKIHSIRNNKHKPVFIIEEAERIGFFKGFLNKFKDFCKLTVNSEIKERIVGDFIIPKVYFDITNSGISARVNFCYGEQIINPFMPQGSFESIEGFFIRNYEIEDNLIDFLKFYGMIQKKELLILDDEDKIVTLLSEGIEKLKDLAEIYYSEEFKKIEVRAIKNVNLGIRLNSDSSLLEFDFNVDDFDQDELYNLIASVKEKKKYFKLKNGSLININNKELFGISDMFKDLNVDLKNIKNGQVHLPASKALFIDNFANEKGLTNISKSENLEKLVHEIIHPEELNFEIDEHLKGILRDYQKFGFTWLKTLSRYGFGGILADDMGLGKTLQVLAFINDEEKNINLPCLVVAPTSLIYNWKAEIEKFVPHLTSIVMAGTKSERIANFQHCDNYNIVITSYGTLKRDISMYKEKKFAYVFVDEAQHIKNPHTLNAGSVKSLHAKGYFAMTGTPVENTLTELWSIFDFVMPGYLMSHGKFISKFEKPIVKDDDNAALDTLSRFIKPFILRRLKSDVLKELPPKIETKIISDMTGDQRKLYAAYLKKVQGDIDFEIKTNGFEKSKLKILAALTRLRQICCHPGTFVEDYTGGSGKLETLIELLEDCLESGHRVIVFSQFTSMHQIIFAELNKLEIPYFYLDGSTPANERIHMVNRFNNLEKPVFLISLKAGGTGLNLVGADTVIHYDSWWNPSVEDQATDRAHRIGQTNVVQVIKIVTKGTIEEKIYALQEKKRGLINSVIRPGENLLTKLGEDEIRDLFMA